MVVVVVGGAIIVMVGLRGRGEGLMETIKVGYLLVYCNGPTGPNKFKQSKLLQTLQFAFGQQSERNQCEAN